MSAISSNPLGVSGGLRYSSRESSGRAKHVSNISMLLRGMPRVTSRSVLYVSMGARIGHSEINQRWPSQKGASNQQTLIRVDQPNSIAATRISSARPVAKGTLRLVNDRYTGSPPFVRD